MQSNQPLGSGSSNHPQGKPASYFWGVPYKAAALCSLQAHGFSHSPTFQPVQRLSKSGSDMAQLPSPGVSWHLNFFGASVHSHSGCVPPQCVSHFISIPPSDFQHPGPSWCWAALPALSGEGAGDLTLLPISCGRCQAWGLSSLGLSADPRDLTVPGQSPYCLFFNVFCNVWLPNFIYGGIPLAVHSVPQKIS